ncbi:meiosis-specific apc c activator protein ama1 [Stemphylium lycopersici]|nr:meiosis-specific apc c activator protein ama1 [Stemphylium lycopersici]
MNDTDDHVSPLNTGYLTPPLSPTKTVSTDGWLSPRTPGSPRKSRSCLFFRDIDTPDPPTPSSPKKYKFISRLEALSTPDLNSTTGDVLSVQPDESALTKQKRLAIHNPSPWYRSPTLARIHARSSPITSMHSFRREAALASIEADSSSTSRHASPARKRRRSNRSSSDSLVDNDIHILPPPLDPTDTINKYGTLELPALSYTEASTEMTLSQGSLRRFPLRHSSSPLRPSQWVACGGSLPSPRHGQMSTSDRFIAQRRPPAMARESFELNSPADRRKKEQATNRDTHTNADAFSRRLRRSGRMNEELRGLRDAHSIISGRANANRRNVNFRRSLAPLAARQISAGAVWNVGGPSAVSDTVVAVSTGRGRMLGSGTNAPLYRSAFLNRADPEAELEVYGRRLALALDIDQTDRIFQHTSSPLAWSSSDSSSPSHPKHVWRDSAWVKDGLVMLLDAPNLRDDYYCTLLAYSNTSKCLAVGLGNFVHLWSERSGVNTPEALNAVPPNSAPETRHVTSLNFSSTSGGQAILAVGRADGRISLWSPFESEPRFDATQPKPVSCVSWRPSVVPRPSLRDRAMTVPTEELLVGDEVGHIYFYSVEWPSETQSALFGWHGAMTLLARLAIHSQQICGLTWSSDGELFASGGNDNNCNLFETKKVLRSNLSTEDNTTAAILDVPTTLFCISPSPQRNIPGHSTRR